MASPPTAPQRQVLGPTSSIEIDAIDETSRRIDIPALADADAPARQLRPGRRWSGCSRTSIRARSTSRDPCAPPGLRSRWAGFTCPAVSRCWTGMPSSLDACRELGISMFAGEAEGRFEAVLRDAADGRLAAALQLHERPAGARGRARRPSCPSSMSPARWASAPASTPVAAAPTSARSAPSSMCRGASRAFAPPTTSKSWCA